MADTGSNSPDAPAALRWSSEVRDVPKVIRLAHTAAHVFDTTPPPPWDEPTRARLASTWSAVLAELSVAVDADAAAELARLVRPFDERAATEGELRIAQAQVTGWLDGLMLGEELNAWRDHVDHQQRTLGMLSATTASTSSAASASPYL